MSSTPAHEYVPMATVEEFDSKFDYFKQQVKGDRLLNMAKQRNEAPVMSVPSDFYLNQNVTHSTASSNVTFRFTWRLTKEECMNGLSARQPLEYSFQPALTLHHFLKFDIFLQFTKNDSNGEISVGIQVPNLSIEMQLNITVSMDDLDEETREVSLKESENRAIAYSCPDSIFTEIFADPNRKNVKITFKIHFMENVMVSPKEISNMSKKPDDDFPIGTCILNINGKIIQIPKVVASANSQYFKNIIENDGKDQVICVEEDFDTFKELVESWFMIPIPNLYVRTELFLALSLKYNCTFITSRIKALMRMVRKSADAERIEVELARKYVKPDECQPTFKYYITPPNDEDMWTICNSRSNHSLLSEGVDPAEGPSSRSYMDVSDSMMSPEKKRKLNPDLDYDSADTDSGSIPTIDDEKELPIELQMDPDSDTSQSLPSSEYIFPTPTKEKRKHGVWYSRSGREPPYLDNMEKFKYTKLSSDESVSSDDETRFNQLRCVWIVEMHVAPANDV